MKLSGQARFSPQMTVRHFITRHDITVEDIGVAPIAIVSWGRGVIEELVEAVDAQPAQHWFYADRIPLFTGKVREQRVTLAYVPVGAAGTVMVMEEMIACGARVLIGLGWAGSLQPEAPVGTMLIPTRCFREEGTSFHYLDAAEQVEPDAQLCELLRVHAEAMGVHIFVGPHWTTDAPYRELVSKIKYYANEGVFGVDMETSAMYALGIFREVKVCNLLVVSDEMWREWNPAFGTQELKEATQRAQQAVLNCLSDQRLYEL